MKATSSREEMDPRLRMWRRRIFAATWLSYFGLYFCRRPFYVVKSALTEEFHWSAADLGLIGTVYLIAYMLGQFVAGTAGNRWGPRLVVLLGMGSSIAINVAFGFTNSLATFAALMTLNGFAQATGWSNNIGIMGNWFRREERGTIMGVWATNFQVGGIVAPSLAALVLASYGFRWAFFSGALVLSAIWLFFFFFQRNRPEDVGLASLESQQRDADAQRVVEPGEAAKANEDAGWTAQVWFNVMLIGLFYFFLKLIRYAIWSWVPYMLNKHYGLGKDYSAYLSTVFDITGFVGVLTAGVVSDRLFNGRRAIVSAISVSGLFVACLVLYLYGQSDLLLFSICLGFIGFTLFGPDALMTGAGAIDVGGAKRAVLAAGIISGLGSVGPIVQEIWLGRLLDQGRVDDVFGVLLGSAGLSLLSISWILYRNKIGKADL